VDPQRPDEEVERAREEARLGTVEAPVEAREPLGGRPVGRERVERVAHVARDCRLQAF